MVIKLILLFNIIFPNQGKEGHGFLSDFSAGQLGIDSDFLKL